MKFLVPWLRKGVHIVRLLVEVYYKSVKMATSFKAIKYHKINVFLAFNISKERLAL